MSDQVLIGGAQGFYGDGLGPLDDLLAEPLDYVVGEALAELTLAILAKDRQRDESLGYTRDLPRYAQAILPSVVEGRTRFITNAGGINPVAAGRAVLAEARSLGARGLKVATVVGDDLRPLSAELELPHDAVFACAYLGARPIVEALQRGAQVVVTGRVADAALFLAPLIYEHGWSWDDWDRLAAGVVVGHLLECSGQVTGGNYSGRWWDNPEPARIAFPVAEVSPDGSAVVTKASGAGGMVTFDTVREQLLYEVHDPARYLTPDVVADFTSLTLTDHGGDRVAVKGTRGLPATSTYKGLVGRPVG
ncbi:MAG: acyclic terpene utilization AtuA family protein, partial [Acidimicrobiales bacterium]